MGEWVNRYEDREQSVSGGYWAMRTNVSRSGKVYNKLVKSDRSPRASIATLLNYRQNLKRFA